MRLSTKILLTLPYILFIGYGFTFAFPYEFQWLVPNMKVYYIQTATLQVLAILHFVILIRRVWSIKHLARSTRWNWTYLIIFFNLIAGPIFIWRKYDHFQNLISNEENEGSN